MTAHPRRRLRRLGRSLPLLLLLAISLVDSWTPNSVNLKLTKRRRTPSVISSIQHRRLLAQEEHVQQEECPAAATATTQVDADDNLIMNSPFYMTYPRYRIYLSSSTSTSSRPQQGQGDATNKDHHPFSFISSLFSSGSRIIQRQELEKDFAGSNLVWMVDKKNGIEAFAALWHESANLYEKTISRSSRTIHQGEERETASATMAYNSSIEKVVVALPDCPAHVVRHWVEIVDWIKQEPDLIDKQNDLAMTVFIDAVLLDEYDIPVVHLTAIQQQRGEQQRDGPLRTNVPQIQQKQQSTSYPLSDSSDVIESRMKAWANRILVSQAICPFTKSVTKSGQGLSDVGVPVARILYHTSHATVLEIHRLMADTWEAISGMMAAGPTGKMGVSSILFAAPAFDYDFALWAGPVFAILEASVIALQAERSIGVVCFHPCYATPDGTSWPGFGHMHSVPRLQEWYSQHYQNNPQISKEDAAAGGAWQRRTPHATINVLRADQLAAAEGRRATGILYAENIHKLVKVIGSDQLTADLIRERNLGKEAK